jgi:capsid protein
MPDFIKAQLKGVSSGLDLSYATLANDLENINFSSAKYATLEDQSMYQNKQHWFIDCFLDRYYRDWLLYQLLTGYIPLPLSKYSKYCRVKWTPRGFKSVNMVETAKAAQLLYGMGLASLTQLSSELLGSDWEETIQTIANENKKLEKLDVKLPALIDILTLEKIAPDNTDSTTKK